MAKESAALSLMCNHDVQLGYVMAPTKSSGSTSTNSGTSQTVSKSISSTGNDRKQSSKPVEKAKRDNKSGVLTPRGQAVPQGCYKCNRTDHKSKECKLTVSGLNTEQGPWAQSKAGKHWIAQNWVITPNEQQQKTISSIVPYTGK